LSTFVTNAWSLSVVPPQDTCTAGDSKVNTARPIFETS